jgi:hypothetical protein
MRSTKLDGKNGGRFGVLLMAVFFLALPFGFGSKAAHGQIVNASLAGSLTDPAGLAIPDAHVTVTDVDTGLSTKTTSNSAGYYIFPSLRPARYDLTVESSGFKTTVMSGIVLLVNQKARVDVPLQVGDVTTKLEVAGAPPLVETSSASVGTVIGERQAVDLPLNLRRYGALATLVPGTTTSNGGFATLTPFSENGYTANGGRATSNNYLIDGGDSKNLDLGGFSLQPPPDSVQEFKIQTNIYSAAFGMTAGSTINLVTKSGTNALHGSVYEFLRNDKLDARNFFASERPKYRRNQYGFTLGGPIRKNKTFFFGNYEGLREIKGLSLTSTVPTSDLLSGNFSSVLTGQTINLCGNGGPSNLNFDSGQLFDPASLQKVTCPAGSAKAGSSVLVGNPIAGNVITNISPVAQKVLSLFQFPAANRAGLPNYVNNTPIRHFEHQVLLRVDHTIGTRDQLSGRYILGNYNNTSSATAASPFPEFADHYYYRAQAAGLTWTHTISPHVLNEARVSFSRNHQDLNCLHCPRAAGFMQSLGIKDFQAISTDFEGFPLFGFSRFGSVGDASYRPADGTNMTEKFQNNITWNHGRHTVVAGADMQFWQALHETGPFGIHGQFFFSGQYSGLANEIPGVQSVSGLADFLLGYPASAARNFRYLPNYQIGGGFWNYYVQDDIKVSPNLAVNVGLRYEYRRPSVDKNDNLLTFVPLGPKFSGPGNGILVTPANDALNDSFCTDPSYSFLLTQDGRCLIATSAQRAKLGFTGRTRRTLLDSTKHDFAPRLGITLRPTGSDKFVIHTGYGVFYDLPVLNNLHFGNYPVFSPNQFYSASFGDPPPMVNGTQINLQNVFAGGVIPSLIDQQISLFPPRDYRSPIVQQWSFGISSQLAQDWAVEVNYVGNRGTHQGMLHLSGNQPNPGLGPLQPRRPYPDFGPFLVTTSDANTTYNSLQAKLTKSFTHGLSLLTSYTFARSIDDSEGDEGFICGAGGNLILQDDNNPRLDRGRSCNDARQRLAVSYIWELPFGKGRRYLDRSGVVNAILGGWTLSGVSSFQSGFPFTPTIGSNPANNGTFINRPDRLCNGEGQKTVNSWFDASCFDASALHAAFEAGHPRFGNSGRNILDGPGLQNWDLALLKQFPVGDRFKLQFRAEFYNAFNRANFGLPASNIEDPSSVGKIFSAGEPRDIQFGLKLSF